MNDPTPDFKIPCFRVGVSLTLSFHRHTLTKRFRGHMFNSTYVRRDKMANWGGQLEEGFLEQ